MFRRLDVRKGFDVRPSRAPPREPYEARPSSGATTKPSIYST